jgi:hypothetical protein
VQAIAQAQSMRAKGWDGTSVAYHLRQWRLAGDP